MASLRSTQDSGEKPVVGDYYREQTVGVRVRVKQLSSDAGMVRVELE